MEKRYVLIVASDMAFNTKNTKYYPNWLTATVVLPDLNEEDLDIDFNNPLFKGMASFSSSQDEDGFSHAGEYFFSPSKKFTFEGSSPLDWQIILDCIFAKVGCCYKF